MHPMLCAHDFPLWLLLPCQITDELAAAGSNQAARAATLAANPRFLALTQASYARL
jgi:hypothetical protein